MGDIMPSGHVISDIDPIPVRPVKEPTEIIQEARLARVEVAIADLIARIGGLEDTQKAIILKLHHWLR
jgi:hypothetical protein